MENVVFVLKEEIKRQEILTQAMNYEYITVSEISQTQRTNIIGFHSYEVPRVVKLIETEIRKLEWWEPGPGRGWGVGIQ